MIRAPDAAQCRDKGSSDLHIAAVAQWDAHSGSGCLIQDTPAPLGRRGGSKGASALSSGTSVHIIIVVVAIVVVIVAVAAAIVVGVGGDVGGLTRGAIIRSHGVRVPILLLLLIVVLLLLLLLLLVPYITTLLAHIAAGQGGVRVLATGSGTRRLLLLLRRIRHRRLGSGGTERTSIALVHRCRSRGGVSIGVAVRVATVSVRVQGR